MLLSANGKESIIYDFKLQKVDYLDESVLTYSLVENGIIKREYLTSVIWYL
ncbi:MAG TPA: hypothetical protein VIH57_21150 [Bacteroidales bacterium]